MVKVTFNGVELTQYITVLEGFSLWKGADFDPQITENTILSGSEFNYTRRKHKTISIPFYVEYESSEGYDFLQSVLNVKEPKELTFDIYPNRVFYAIPSGDLNFNEYKLSGKGTIKFIVPDGLAHATYTRTFEFEKNDSGIFEAEIINDGSEEVAVDYEIKLKKESGFIAVTSPYGLLQYGKYDEEDGYIDRKNVTLLSNQKGDFANWSDGTTFYENPNKIVTTQMGYDSELGGRLGTMPANFPTSGTAGAFGYGACKEYILETPVEQWYIWARAWFETGFETQNGEWCLAVIDEQNHLLAGMAIEKNNRVQNKAAIRFLLGDGNGGSIVKREFDLTPSLWIPPNPYGNNSRIQGSNMFDLVKEKDRVQFFYNGGYYPFSASQLNGKKAKRIQFFVGNYAGSDSSVRQFVTHHYLNDFTFQELHVPYWKDVPNRYPTGAVIEIDGSAGEIRVNKQIRLDDEILGTNYFKVPPGKTKVQLNISSFGEIESATATIKEVYV